MAQQTRLSRYTTPGPRDLSRQFRVAILILIGICLFGLGTSVADVPAGDPDLAKAYYRTLATTLEFSTPAQIIDTTLDDVASYLGYNGVTGGDMQDIPSATLMDPEALLLPRPAASGPSATLRQINRVISALGPIPFRPDDVLAIRFFAPKIMNIKDPESTRLLGWRKLVRLRARSGSPAADHHIAYGIILFNTFNSPTESPFSHESINTQVMLVTEANKVPPPNGEGPAAIYWLDYLPLSAGGKLSLALDAAFDSNELPQGSSGKRSYYVPDGCVACHGNNGQRSLVNYLDTDHWFDRLQTDFQALRDSKVPLLFDAGTNDTSTVQFKLAFDAIRRFNKEADEEVATAQPKHDEALASHKWLEIHQTNNDAIPPAERAIGSAPLWSLQDPDDGRALAAFNQYCFRCHGTVKFSVFNKSKLQQPDFRALIEKAIARDAVPGIKMPPDRDLPDGILNLLHDFITR